MSRNSTYDHSIILGDNKVLPSASRDFGKTLREIQVITYGHSKHQQTGPVIICIAYTRFMRSVKAPRQINNLAIKFLSAELIPFEKGKYYYGSG